PAGRVFLCRVGACADLVREVGPRSDPTASIHPAKPARRNASPPFFDHHPQRRRRPPPMSHSSHAPYVATRRALTRRRFLQGTGTLLALPFLDAMLPAFVRAAESSSPLAPGAKPRRMFGICNNLGLLGDNFFPTGTGRDYAASPYLRML